MKRPILILGGIVMLLLAGAAFVGARLLNGQGLPEASSGMPRKFVTPAAGVPTAPPDARGDVISRAYNSLMLCDSESAITVNPAGTINTNPDCDLEIEVVIGHDTVLIHDVSALHNRQSKEGQNHVIIQQFIEPGSAADIYEGTAVRAWGVRSGDRFLARTLLYFNRLP
jgi:hypothetical protein